MNCYPEPGGPDISELLPAGMKGKSQFIKSAKIGGSDHPWPEINQLLKVIL
jgi:hypothetical protein